VVASFAAYALERACSGRTGQVGRGAIEGVAGPEAANNAAAQTSFVPLLTMGIPSNPVIGLLLGALIVHGIQPGPGIIQKEPALFWGLVASMWVGNAVLLVLNLPFAGLWARLLRLPYDYLYPATIAISCVGIYAVSHSTTDLWLAAGFAAVGWALKRCGLHPAALLLGFVLSRPLEENVRRALTFSHGGLSTFLTHPLSAVLLGSAVVMLVVVGSSRMRSKRRNEESGAAPL
jgi:TctA family transporter